MSTNKNKNKVNPRQGSPDQNNSSDFTSNHLHEDEESAIRPLENPADRTNFMKNDPLLMMPGSREGQLTPNDSGGYGLQPYQTNRGLLEEEEDPKFKITDFNMVGTGGAQNQSTSKSGAKNKGKKSASVVVKKKAKPNKIGGIFGGNLVVEEEVDPDNPQGWAMNIGVPKITVVKDFIREELKPKDSDVYPLSIHYSDSSKRWMKAMRVIFLLFCIWVCVPFDLYFTSHDYRIGYFGTDVFNQTVPLADITNNFTFILVNCKVNILTNGANKTSMNIEYGVEFQTTVTFNKSMLYINALPTQTCIVNVGFPSGGVALPS